MPNRNASKEDQLALGFLGGNFDPPHHGHLLAAQEASLECDLHQVLFCPYDISPRSDDRSFTPTKKRVEMTKIALENFSQGELSRIDLDRDGPSYTVDSLQILQDQYPDADLFLIIGDDNLQEFADWHRPKEILSMARLFVLNRHQYDEPIPSSVHSMNDKFSTNRILLQNKDGPSMRISSSMIRQRRQQGLPVRYLLPEQIRQYIQKHNLYVNGFQS